jgi:hypothetical protein
MTSSEGTAIPAAVADAMRAELASVAQATVAEIIVEVPSYADAFSGDMGKVIRNAVELALGGFLELATASSGADASTPIRPALDGAYSSAGARRAAAARWTPCSPRTGWARGSPGGTSAPAPCRPG